MTTHDLMRQWLESGDPVKVAHATWRLTQPDSQPVTPYTGPLPTCPYASPGLTGSCNPIRCWANRGITCGGSHSTLDHCHRCLYPRKASDAG